MKKCAYCEKGVVMTKEHIWPNCIIKKYEKGLISYNGRIKKYYHGDPLIRDVCAVCNNDLLSDIDTYLGNLYDGFFSTVIQPGEKANLEYDFDLLLRGLLKISYNSSRANKEEEGINIHKKFAKYILNGGYKPRVVVKLQIVTASKMITPDNDVEELFEPYLLRCGKIDYPGRLAHRFIVRMVAINSFWFYLILAKKNESEYKWKEFINGFDSSMIIPGVLLKSHSRKINIPVEKTTYIHLDLLDSLVEAAKNPIK